MSTGWGDADLEKGRGQISELMLGSGVYGMDLNFLKTDRPTKCPIEAPSRSLKTEKKKKKKKRREKD